MPGSLKEQAEEIITVINQELREVQQSPAAPTGGKMDALFGRLLRIVNDVDLAQAEERVEAIRQKNAAISTDALIQTLIRDKCRQTAAVGAATSGAGLIPGVGTVAALVFGTAADVGATFRLQAELVLEIACVHQYPLNEQEKQRLVLLITGLSAGTATLARKAGQQAGVMLSEKLAEKSIFKALPVVGVIASAGTNVLATYIIGARADAYFKLGAEELQSWQESLRAVTGVDERKIGQWLAESGQSTGLALATGAEKAGQAGKNVGLAVRQKAQQGARLGKKGLKIYFGLFSWGISFWKGVFSRFGKAGRGLGSIITAIPRQLSARFRNKK